MPRTREDRYVYRQRLDGFDWLIVTSLVSERDAKKIAAKAFRDYESGEKIFALGQFYAVMDDQ